MEIGGEFLSDFLDFSALFLQGSGPRRNEAQNSRPKASALLFNFNFLSPKILHADFLLTGETKWLRRRDLIAVVFAERLTI